jgi:hypothetical protein
MSLITARSISLDSTFKEDESTFAKTGIVYKNYKKTCRT